MSHRDFFHAGSVFQLIFLLKLFLGLLYQPIVHVGHPLLGCHASIVAPLHVCTLEQSLELLVHVKVVVDPCEREREERERVRNREPEVTESKEK